MFRADHRDGMGWDGGGSKKFSLKKKFFANKIYLLFCIDLDQHYFFGIMIFFDFFVIFSKTASLLLAADEPNSRFLASAAITGPSVCRQPGHRIG